MLAAIHKRMMRGCKMTFQMETFFPSATVSSPIVVLSGSVNVNPVRNASIKPAIPAP